MGTARRLVLENRLGQDIRVMNVAGERVHVIYRRDSRRVEAHSDTKALDAAGVSYTLLSEVKASAITSDGFALPNGLGRVKAMAADTKIASNPVQLPEEDERGRMLLVSKRTAIAHGVAVALMIGLSFLTQYLKKDLEPQLVTIEVPKIEKPVVARVAPTTVPVAKVQPRPTVKPRSQVQIKRVKTNTPVVVRPKVRSVENMGALAAMGGLRNGHRGSQGLDPSSMRDIRSAGVGAGGGGVGAAGRGGIAGPRAGTGLIAGSAGRGARGEGAGGYGTRGIGGGRAGYGTVALVGGSGGVSLPAGDDGDVAGGLHADQIYAVINRNMGQILYCYEQGLQERSDLRGVVSTKFTINPQGRLSIARVANSTLGATAVAREVENCMMARMRSWQFPKPLGGVNVDAGYPFNLRKLAGR